MRILDRYILRKFIHAYAIVFVSLIGLYIVIDAFSNLDEFSEQAGGLSALLRHMGSYYGYRMSLFFDQLSAVITMIAAMFTLTWMRRSGELAPLLSAGVPMVRIVAPVLGAAVVVNLLILSNQEWVIPNIRLQLLRDADEGDELKAAAVQSAYDYATNVLLDAALAYPAQRRIESVDLVLPASLAGELLSVRAKEAYYREKKAPSRAGWELVGARSSVDLDRLPPAAQRVLYRLPSGNYFLTSDVTPEQLTRNTHWIEYSSTAELAASLRNPSLGLGPDQAVYFHSRLLRPLNNFVLLLMGLPFVLGRENRNIFINMAICLVVSGVFFTVVSGCQYLGTLEYLSPALAAWSPVMLFGSALPLMLDIVQT